jgi:hypothetical protein
MASSLGEGHSSQKVFDRGSKWGGAYWQKPTGFPRRYKILPTLLGIFLAFLNYSIVLFLAIFLSVFQTSQGIQNKYMIDS